MADEIKKYTDQILNATYGEEVRAAIVSALKECYSLVKDPDRNVDTAIAELSEKSVQFMGTYPAEEDWDNAEVNTIYFASANRIADYEHGASQINRAYVLTVGVGDSGTRVQYWLDPITGDVYIRMCLAGTWSHEWTTHKNRIFAAKAKMLVKGNSIMAGSIWQVENGTIKYQYYPSAWGNAPYSVVAERLGVTKDNINIHSEPYMHSATGLLYNPTNPSTGEPSSTGSFVDIICGNESLGISPIDLTDYDYLLTMFWLEDIRNFEIGSKYSTAGDGSLVGGVRKLLDYINSSNSGCRLILLSVPPVNNVERYSGERVFTEPYGTPNHQSISQLDDVMHRLADECHFVYVDWQGMNLSYHYREFTGGTIDGERRYNVHANNEETYRRMGEYAAECIHPLKAESVLKADFDVADFEGGGIRTTDDGTELAYGPNAKYIRTRQYVYYELNRGDQIRVERTDAVHEGTTPSGTTYETNFRRMNFTAFVQYDGETVWRTTGRKTEYTALQHLKCVIILTDILPNDEEGGGNIGSMKLAEMVKRLHIIRNNVVGKEPYPAKMPLYFSVIDDDCANNIFAWRFREACLHNGITGAYAVQTDLLADDTDAPVHTFIDPVTQEECEGYNDVTDEADIAEAEAQTMVNTRMLLGYEDDGMGMLTHCGLQTSIYRATTDAQLKACRVDMNKALRAMRTAGFVNYNHFVIPYGTKSEKLRDVARQCGFRSAISTSDDSVLVEAPWNTDTDINCFWIKRCGIIAREELHELDTPKRDTTVSAMKKHIDDFVSNGSGWLIMTTHFCDDWTGANDGRDDGIHWDPTDDNYKSRWTDYEWDTTEDENGYQTGYALFNEIIEYAKSHGCVPIPYTVAIEKFKQKMIMSNN